MIGEALRAIADGTVSKSQLAKFTGFAAKRLRKMGYRGEYDDVIGEALLLITTGKLSIRDGYEVLQARQIVGRALRRLQTREMGWVKGEYLTDEFMLGGEE